MDQIDLSIVIPVYRSEETLRPLVDRLTRVLNKDGRRYEIIFVDDGSPDNSWDVLCDLQRAHSGRIVAIQLMRNFGQHNALMCGFRHARGRSVVTMDDDLQHPPEAIPRLLEALEGRGLDLVYGGYERKQHFAWRNAGSGLVNCFYRATFHNRITVTSFRAIRGELLASILPYDLSYTYMDGLFAWSTRRIGEVAVEHHPRAIGRSGYSFSKLLILALNLFTTFSLLPLQLVSICGFLAAGGGLMLSLYYLIEYFRSDIDVPGYASTIIAVLFLGGIQLLSLGIIGEYLGRLHQNVNRKPQYVERRVLSPTPRGAAGVSPLPRAGTTTMMKR